MIRESGGDRSSVTGGTTVLSDRIVVQITAAPGRVVRRPDDRAGRGRAAAEDAQRDRADDPARRADDHLPARRRRAAADGRLLRRAAVAGGAHRAAGLPHPDDDRRAALGHRHRRDGPARAAQRARHVRPGRRGRGRRRHPAARQDRHDHLRQPPGHRADPGARGAGGGAGRGRPAVQPGRPDARRAAASSSCAPREQRPSGRGDPRTEATAEFVPFTAQTRMSGLDVDGRAVRKGAGSAVAAWLGAGRPAARRSRRPSTEIGEQGGTPLVVAEQAGRQRAGARRRRAVRRGQARHGRAVRASCARWASAR